MTEWANKVLTKYKWLCGIFKHKYVTHGIYPASQKQLNGTHFIYRYICTRCGKIKDL